MKFFVFTVLCKWNLITRIKNYDLTIIILIIVMCLAAMVRAQCSPRCSRELSPICAARYNDGNIEFKTHSNPCMLKYYNCMNPTKGMRKIVKRNFLFLFILKILLNITAFVLKGTTGMSCSYIGYPETTSDWNLRIK